MYISVGTKSAITIRLLSPPPSKLEQKIFPDPDRYRKYHLFGPELETLQTPAPHLSAFSTDFGAVIGLMTCFDILFEVPGVEMVRRGVTQFAFPTNWGDQLPSLTGQ